MLTEKERDFQPHVVSLESLVPKDNFYRQVEAKLDLTFVRDLVRHLYKPFGRPGIDPVVFFKLQLIMFFEGIRSERQLMDMVAMRLDCRWYLGYDLDEDVPDHSSLSKIRDRFGLEVFQCFFERIVEMCVDAGLVWGQELYVDGTKVQANAAIDGMVPRFYWEARQHLAALFEAESDGGNPGDPNPEHPLASSPRGFVDKYDGTRILGHRAPSYERITDSKVRPVDPDASPMRRFAGDRAQLGYHDHYVVDGGKARIILAALVTPASIMDNTPMLDLIRWSRFRWHLQPRIAVGDTKYGTVPNIVGLEQDGIRAYLPTPTQSRSDHFYPLERFQ
jgi:transposase